MKKWIYALIAVLMLPGMSLALDGNEMLQACKIAIRVNDYNDRNPGNRFGIAKCSYYVAGFKEAVEFNEDWLDERDKNLGYGTYRFLCVPDDVTIMQVIGAFVNYMEQHPEDLNDPAYSILTMTFLEVFPCLK